MREKEEDEKTMFLRDKNLSIGGEGMERALYNLVHLLHSVVFFAPVFTSMRKTMRERKGERLQIWEYRLLFCVTLISPRPNLFPQRSLEKLLAGAWKCTAQKTQSCCDRRSCYKVSCGEPSLCKVLSTRCSATETFQPSSSFSTP